MTTKTYALLLGLGLGTTACYEGAPATTDAELDTDGVQDTDGSSDGDTDADTDGDPSSPGELDPGRVTLRRLNTTEYANTVRDLMYGLDVDPTAEFPPDPRALGFDNNADVLTLSPVQFSLYERATDAVLEAAIDDPASADVRDQLVPCELGEPSCAPGVIARFGERAYRRELTEDERQGLIAEYDVILADGASEDEALKAAFKRALLSVHFLFRVELDDDPTSTQAHFVSDFELASRLSYFVWSTMPDDALFEAARAGDLRDPEVLQAQVRRLLADPRAIALQENFAGQWLSLRGIRELTKEPTAFPDFDAQLAEAMATEAELFVQTFFEDDRPITELLTSTQTFVNDRLAAHYGLEGQFSGSFEPASLEDVKRKGLLTQAGLMARLAHEDKTAPTQRGAWVLSQLLCTPPPPPPADVPDLDESEGSGKTARERLEKHVTDPSCAGCHLSMDPIGLALEKYDASGAYRVAENSTPIDASGELGGQSFDDALGMADILAEDETQLAACVSKHMLTYALGREFAGGDDVAHIQDVAEDFTDAGLRLPELVVAVVLSDAFRARRGEPG